MDLAGIEAPSADVFYGTIKVFTSLLSVAKIRSGGNRRIRKGADADIAVFDPAGVIDRATYERPNLPSAGISYVISAARSSLDRGEIVEGACPGKGIRATNRPSARN